MNTINDRQNQIIDDFLILEDWMSQYSYLLDMAGKFPKTLDCRNDENLVKGCQSKAWVRVSEDMDNKITVDVDSDALIIKGILGMIAWIYDGNSAEDIAHSQMYVIEKTALREKLSSQRAMGVESAIDYIKKQAMDRMQSK